jgi:uncharacterized protein DUF5677
MRSNSEISDWTGILPEFPTFTDDLVAECKRSGDFRRILFEWYKHVALVAINLACIKRGSAALRAIPAIHYGVLIGLLNRCSRLMHSNIALSSTGLFGETMMLLDRSIFESAITLLWLCEENADEAFQRFVLNGLQAEIALKAEIDKRCMTRGHRVAIEDRMLKSIQRYFTVSGVTEAEVTAAQRLPNLAAMVQRIGQDRLAYVVGQKITSQSVHGTWAGLLTHYLRWEVGEEFHPRDHDCEPHVDQFVFVPLTVLSAAKGFCSYVIEDAESRQQGLDRIQQIEREIHSVHRLVVGADLEPVETS